MFDSVRSRRLLAPALVASALCLASSARAGWAPGGITVSPTTSSIPMVEACSDGGSGTFVVWQEEAIPGVGVLRAQHLLASGDLDPAWPAAGAVACSLSVARADLGVLPDHLGGLYLWWRESAMLYLKRLDASGQTAPAWPARGRALGSLFMDCPDVCAVEDGGQGIYLAWADVVARRGVVVHLGPANTGVGGWPTAGRAFGASGDGTSIVYYPQVAPAPEGGAFVAWATFSSDSTVTPWDYRLLRVTAAATPAAGWDPSGLPLGAFHRETISGLATSNTLALAADGRGGVFVVTGDLQDIGAGTPVMDVRARRLQGGGQPASDWPAGGMSVIGSYGYASGGPDGSLRAVADGLDGVQVGSPQVSDHSTDYHFAHLTAAGDYVPGGGVGGGVAYGHEYASTGSGSLFFADFHATGPQGPYDMLAFLHVTQSPSLAGWTDFNEIHSEIVVPWYGDIGLAPTSDGAVFVWSQVRERVGLFARRFGPAGEVTGVPETRGPSPFALARLRFVPGAGVRAAVSWAVAGPARLALYDVMGRRVASQDLPRVAGAREVTLAGTGALPSGLYFARLTAGRAEANGKVVVAR